MQHALYLVLVEGVRALVLVGERVQIGEVLPGKPVGGRNHIPCGYGYFPYSATRHLHLKGQNMTKDKVTNTDFEHKCNGRNSCISGSNRPFVNTSSCMNVVT